MSHELVRQPNYDNSVQVNSVEIKRERLDDEMHQHLENGGHQRLEMKEEFFRMDEEHEKLLALQEHGNRRNGHQLDLHRKTAGE